MKFATTLAMALIVALVASIALVPGVSSATELCTKAEDPCEAASIVEGKTSIEASATKTAVLKGSTLTVECSESTIKGETRSTAGRPFPVKISSISFATCKGSSGACTVSTLNAPYAAGFEKSGTDKATFTLADEQKAEVGFEVTCGSTKCEFTAKEASLSAAGGNPGTITAEEEPFAVKGAAPCPKTGTWTTPYKVTAPNPVHIAQWSTKICTAEPTKEGKCPEGKEFGGGEIEGKLAKGEKAELEFVGGGPTGVITCTEEKVKGTLSKGGTGEITSFTYSSEGGKPCTSTIEGKPTVEVEVSNLPFTASLDYQPGPLTGQMYAGAVLWPPLYLVRVGGVSTCLYTFWFSQFLWNVLVGTFPDFLGTLVSGAPGCGLAIDIRGRMAYVGLNGILYLIP